MASRTGSRTSRCGAQCSRGWAVRFGPDITDYVGDGVPVIRGENLSGRWVNGEFVYVSAEKAQKLRANTAGPGDVVFTQRGANHFRQVAVVPPSSGRYVISQSQMKVTVDRAKVEPLFLYYAFRAPEQQEYLQRNAIHTGVPHTNLGILGGVPLHLPTLSEQRGIIEVLGALDDKIELNRRMNETLQTIARAMFAHATTNADEFNRVDEVAELNVLQLRPGDGIDQIDYVEISEVSRGEVGTIVTFERGSEPTRARRRVSHGDTVLSTVRPDRGAYFLALNPPRSLVVSTGFAVVSARSVPWTFLHVALTESTTLQELGRLADGGAYPAVRPEVIAALEVPLLPSGDLAAFHELVGPLFEKAETNRRQSKTLAELRDTLLPKLLSGDLRVREAEKLASEAV